MSRMQPVLEANIVLQGK
jgi:hypothetical protein